MEIPTDIAVQELFDPLARHPNLDRDYMVETCGLLRPWSQQGLSASFEMVAIKDALEEARGFPVNKSDSTTLPDGTHQYEGDPDMYPLWKGWNSSVEIFIYEYGMITFRQTETGECFTTRMD